MREIELSNAFDNGVLSGRISVIKTLQGTSDFLEQDTNESTIDGRYGNWKHDRKIEIKTLREMVKHLLKIYDIPKSVLLVATKEDT